MINLTRWAGVVLTLFTLQVHAEDKYYVNPDSTVTSWLNSNPADSRAATIKTSIAEVPAARWFTGTSQPTGNLAKNVASYTGAAKSANKIPIMVIYNIPGRDCSGGASAGGAKDAATYENWIDIFVSGVGARQAVVVLEPDAIADIECLSLDKRTERTRLLAYAVDAFKNKAPAAQLYLDAGNAHWKPAATMATYLAQAGVKNAKGFALNVSNFYTTSQTTAYGNQINSALSAAHGYTRSMLVDTSRNGNGANSGEWCNPPGRKIGIKPQAISSSVLAVWVKIPGDSDGASSPTADCHGGPPAGTFSPDLAVKLINGQ